jgi:hypothetical protein
MSIRVVRVEPIASYRLDVEFDDGVYGTIDLSDRLFGEMFEPLRDEETFRSVSIDEYGAVCWPNGADLAPDAIHQTLIERRFPPSARGRVEIEAAAIMGRMDCIEQLLAAFRDIADRDDIRRAAERLVLVQEWVRREAERAAADVERGDAGAGTRRAVTA